MVVFPAYSLSFPSLADTTIYNMCTQKPPHDHSEQLYKRYQGAFETYIKERVMPDLQKPQGEELLRHVVMRWSNHKVMVRWLSRFFNYLDRYYVQRHNLHNLHNIGIIVFRNTVYSKLKCNIRNAALKLVESEREGEQIDTSLLRDVLGIFQEVGMGSLTCYQEDFESYLLKSTSDYYGIKGANWIEEDSTPEYLEKAESALRAEEGRVENYLHVESKGPLLNAVQTQLLAEHQMQLLEKEGSGCAALLRENRSEDLARMFRLFNRLGTKGLEPMADIFRKHVESEGMKLVQEAGEAAEVRRERASERERGAGSSRSSSMRRSEPGGGAMTAEHLFIRRSIELHDAYEKCVVESFSGSPLFHKALKEAFESFCNKKVAGASAAELMATFCDTLLRKGGGERLSDEEQDQLLDKVVELLQYVSDKDLFSEFYQRKLSRRLLNLSAGVNEDAEKGVLSRLKQMCGTQFTSQMEGMVQDLQLAKEKEKEFAEWLGKKNFKLPIDTMNVTVLTRGFWPSYKTSDITLPDEMMTGVEYFTTFFEETHSKTRRLSWLFGQGSVHITATFGRTYEIITSPFQAAVLLQFNSNESDDDGDLELSFAELRSRTKLSDEDLTRVLQSLTLMKYKLLLKSPENKTIGTEDTFRVNTSFSDKLRRIKLGLPPQSDRRKVHEDVENDRKQKLDAAIVRIMKSRKTLSHQQLVMEVVQQVQRTFQPDVRQIKRCIEGLIERDYLERDSSNTQMYKYMA